MAELNAQKRLAEAQALLERARQYPPSIGKGDYEVQETRRPKGVTRARFNRTARHNLAHKAVVLLIGPLHYSEFTGILTEEDRRAYEGCLAEACALRGY